jgi:hypothetical protein
MKIELQQSRMINQAGYAVTIPAGIHEIDMNKNYYRAGEISPYDAALLIRMKAAKVVGA